MALSEAILAHARKVSSDGLLKLTDPVDKAALLEICRLAADEADGKATTRYAAWSQVYSYIVSILKDADRTCGWQTARIAPGETDVQRQAREDAIYGMLASLYLLARDGVKVGMLEGR